ncbi:MAG: hypothetical protein PHT99_09005 [Methanoregula sp.]|nr:hypothetical protein [Methanoregula sp.]
MVKDGHHEGVIREIARANQNTKIMKTCLKPGNDDFYNEFSDKTGIKKMQISQNRTSRNNAPSVLQ